MSRLALLLLLLLASAAALVVQFDNTAPVVDVGGTQVDAHDGMIVQFDPPHGLYYRYAIEYGLYSEVGHLRSNGGGCLNHCDTCGGFRFDHNVSVWTTPTLANRSWTLVTREALPIKTRPVASYYRPKVVFNAATGLYVLWVNYAPGGYGHNGHYLSATSATPEGPFEIAVVDVVMDAWTGNHGDFDLFRDSDGRAYVLYTCYCGPGGTHGGTTVSVVELTADYLNSTANRSAPLANGAGTNAPVFAESPALFKNEAAGYFYALITHVCCFCRQGGGVSVFTAAHPLGPFSPVAYDIGCANKTSDVDGCSSSVGEYNVPACECPLALRKPCTRARTGSNRLCAPHYSPPLQSFDRNRRRAGLQLVGRAAKQRLCGLHGGRPAAYLDGRSVVLEPGRHEGRRSAALGAAFLRPTRPDGALP